jgi:VanZ family protein
MDQKNHAAYKRVAGGVCLCVLGIILTAGLWPFHVPTNQVEWLKNEDGLQFGRLGSVVTSGAIRGNSPTYASATLEIWLEPAHVESGGTILSFDGSTHPGEPFSLHQKGNSFGIRLNNVDPQGVSRTALFYVDRVSQKNPLFVTIVLDSQGASVYINGVLAGGSWLSRTWNDLTGRIVLGNSPTADDSWAGKILGLAVYQRELTASQIAADYANWTSTGHPVPATDRDAAALYLFDERGGKVVHNRLDPATDFTIPAHYFVLHPGFLVAPWKAYHPTWSYWQDVGVNIAGFVPLGFCVVAYLSLTRAIKHPAATTVILGFFTSLSIELLQVLLPTRDSDITDLITNTLGTVIGVMVYRSSICQALLTKAKVAIARTNLSGVGVRSPR